MKESRYEMKKFLSAIKRMWLLFAQMLGKVNAVLLLSIVYIVVIGLMSILARLLRKDLLRKKIDSDLASYWQIRHSSEQTLDRNKFQF
jgi:hypothetical protein